MSNESYGPRPCYVYLRTSAECLADFLMFHNYSYGQMLMEIYGLAGGKARLKHEFPERRLRNSELSAVDFLWPEARDVDYQVEHITCHSDGTFHIKTRGDKTVYLHRRGREEPIHPDTGLFLDFKVISDVAEKYRTHNCPTSPNAIFDVPADQAFLMEGSFSGSRYPLEREVVGRLHHRSGATSIFAPALVLRSGTIKGIFAFSTSAMPRESLQTKPDGTLISFKFPDGEDYSVLKTFFFS